MIMKVFEKEKIRRVLEGKLNEITATRKTKEVNYKIYIDGKFVTRITVPKGRGSLPRGTLKSINRQFLLPPEKFNDLIECPLSKNDYIRILTKKEREV